VRHDSRPRRFDWPAARHPEYSESIPSMSARILKAAPPPSCYRTGKTAAASRPALTHRSPRSSPPLCLAVGGHGGVSGTLLRKEQPLGCRGKRHPGRSPICVWCRRQGRGQLKKQKLAMSSSRDGARRSRLRIQNSGKSSREFRGARLDFSVHIWVRRRSPPRRPRYTRQGHGSRTRVCRTPATPAATPLPPGRPSGRRGRRRRRP